MATENISARVINIATIKPLDEEIILSAARDCKRIVTVEEHSIIGGGFVKAIRTLRRKYRNAGEVLT